MTEKRFTLEEFGLNFIVNDNGRNLTAKQTVDKLNQLYEENEQLKQELHKYDDWCNSVKRENIDKVLKMSVFEIVELFEYYDEKIEDYEKVLNGDVE